MAPHEQMHGLKPKVLHPFVNAKAVNAVVAKDRLAGVIASRILTVPQLEYAVGSALYVG